MLIKSINAKKKEFVFRYEDIDLVVPFKEITGSVSWEKDHMLAVSFKNGIGQDCITFFAKNAFTDNIAHHLPEHRARPEDYEQDVLVFKLYRLLEGATEKEADAEVENIYNLRLELAEKKSVGEIESFAKPMKKLINLALDESKPDITLKNISLDNLNS